MAYSNLQPLYDQYGNLINNQMQNYTASQSMYGFGSFGSTINTINAGLGIAGSLMNIYSGFKSLDMAEDQLDMQKEQFELAKEELEHKKTVRSNLTARW